MARLKRTHDRRGMTLLELIVALAVVSILMGTAAFAFHQWQSVLQSKTLARQMASMLRASRAESVSTQREVRVKFLAEGEAPGAASLCFQQRGNLSQASTLWEDRPGSRLEFPRQQRMGYTSGCESAAAPKYLSFNPDGTSNTLYVCVQQEDENHLLQKQFAVGVSSASTGRIVLLRWNPARLRFE